MNQIVFEYSNGNNYNTLETIVTCSESKKPIDLRFIDFQLIRLGTPVHDLSYCLYSGGTKEIFDELDYYLEIYHEALTNVMKEFRVDPRIYPLRTLKKEWKEYARFGFVLGLVLLKGKLVYENAGLSFAEMIANADQLRDMERGRYDAEEVKRRSLDLISHMYERDFLFR